VLDERGEKLLSYRDARRTRRRAAVYTELSTSDIKFPTVKLATAPRSSYPRELPRAAHALRAGRPREGVPGAHRHLRGDGEYLRGDLRRRAAARLVHGAGAQLRDTLERDSRTARSRPKS
jgi:hypothetical protein